MQLLVNLHCVCSDDAPPACGIEIIDASNDNTLHAVGRVLAGAPHPALAPLITLQTALEDAAPFAPTRLQLHTTSTDLVDLITTEATPDSPEARDLYEQTLMTLLRIESWQLGPIDPDDTPRLLELAHTALTEAGHATPPTPTPPTPDYPRWTATIMTHDQAGCPKPPRTATAYPFGPDTPADLCIYAAQAVMRDSPLTWDDPERQRMTTSCAQCGCPIEINRIDSSD